jgi:hypothetical protein
VFLYSRNNPVQRIPKLMLPNPKHGPTDPLQGRRNPAVFGAVHQDLRLPEGRVRVDAVLVAFSATVPEAAVREDCQTRPPKHEVRTAW